ncbi:MAG: hypothetical protein R3B12_05275 [Candidatus Saccharimonadales bacterium]
MSKQSSPRFKKSMPFGSIALVVLFVGLAVFGGYFFVKYQNVNTKYKEVTQSVEDRDRQLVQAVSKLYAVPAYEKEKPTVLLVSDKDQLKSASDASAKFFENAENNDYVLAYKDADISIIYRKGENRIIKIDNYSNFVAAANPINISLLAADAAQKSIQDKISQQFKNAVVSNKSTPKTAQTKGVVYATSPDFNDASKQLAQLLGYDVGSLPAGEDAPAQGTDIVIVAPVANQ